MAKKKAKTKAKTADAKLDEKPEEQPAKKSRKRTDKDMSGQVGMLSMAQEVREYLRANPEASNRQTVDDLSSQGVVVNDYLPSFIRHELAREARKEEGASKKKVRQTPDLPRGKLPTVYVLAPFAEGAIAEMLRSDNPNKVVRNIRILVTQLNRMAEIISTLTDDDWKTTMLPEMEGFLFFATHNVVKDVSQARARTQKLGLMPNEIEIVPAEDA